MINPKQQEKALHLWDYYVECGGQFYNANEETSATEIDKQRRAIIPETLDQIHSYIKGQTSLQNFKSEIDGLNKKNRLWGFKGINGQMYFNMLFNSSSGAGLLDSLDSALKQAIPMPQNMAEAKVKIDSLESFSQSLAKFVSDKRQAPRSGSILFFISYFWQIQDHEKWPIYYKSMLNALQDADLWTPSGVLSTDYEEFNSLNIQFVELFKTQSKKPVSLWDVEHAFWVSANSEDQPVSPPRDATEISKVPMRAQLTDLPTSYVPPVVSVIPALARSDPKVAQLCSNSGVSPSKAFEERIATLFKILGYKVEPMGQGMGRIPDGIAISNEYHYALIFDAKARAEAYSVGTDDRAIKEYIHHQTDRLKRQGIRNVYFAIISSEFRGDYDDLIRTIKMETEVREILFIEAEALLVLLEHKLREPEFDLGPRGVQNIFAQSGTITTNYLKEFLS